MTPDRTDATPDENAEHGVLDESGNLDTASITILGGHIAQVSVDLPAVSTDDDIDDDVVEDEVPVDEAEIRFENIGLPFPLDAGADAPALTHVPEPPEESEPSADGEVGQFIDHELNDDAHVEHLATGDIILEPHGDDDATPAEEVEPELEVHDAEIVGEADDEPVGETREDTAGDPAPPSGGIFVAAFELDPTGFDPAAERLVLSTDVFDPDVSAVETAVDVAPDGEAGTPADRADAAEDSTRDDDETVSEGGEPDESRVEGVEEHDGPGEETADVPAAAGNVDAEADDDGAFEGEADPAHDAEPHRDAPSDDDGEPAQASDRDHDAQAAVEDIAVDDARVEDTWVEDAPAEDAPAEDAPVDDASAEDAPTDDAAADDTSTKDAEVEDERIDDAESDDAVVEHDTEHAYDESVHDQPAYDESVHDQPAYDESAHDESAHEEESSVPSLSDVFPADESPTDPARSETTTDDAASPDDDDVVVTEGEAEPALTHAPWEGATVATSASAESEAVDPSGDPVTGEPEPAAAESDTRAVDARAEHASAAESVVDETAADGRVAADATAGETPAPQSAVDESVVDAPAVDAPAADAPTAAPADGPSAVESAPVPSPVTGAVPTAAGSVSAPATGSAPTTTGSVPRTRAERAATGAIGTVPLTRREIHQADEAARVGRAHALERVRTPGPDVTLTSKRLSTIDDARESPDLLTADRLLDPRQVARPEPEGLWQQLVYSISGRRINLGDGRRARQRKELDRRIAAPLAGGARFVPVLSRKGGVGKTTVTSLLGMALADARDDRVIAVDANPDRGTLADRVGRPNGRTVRDLVRAHDEVEGYHDVSSIVARDATRLDVLASDSDPRVSEAFSDDDYRQVADVAAHYYSIVLTDTGTGIVHSVMEATLERADSLVVVAGLSVDEARLASETLTWLETNGYADRVRSAIVVLNAARPGAPLVRESELETHFRTRVQTVIRMPYDPRIAAGSAISFRDLQPETRQAARELAAAVVEGLRAPVAAA